MSFWRFITCQIESGSAPLGFHRCTEKMVELLRGLSSSTASIGVFEYTPPSQYGSPSMPSEVCRPHHEPALGAKKPRTPCIMMLRFAHGLTMLGVSDAWPNGDRH